MRICSHWFSSVIRVHGSFQSNKRRVLNSHWLINSHPNLIGGGGGGGGARPTLLHTYCMMVSLFCVSYRCREIRWQLKWLFRNKARPVCERKKHFSWTHNTHTSGETNMKVYPHPLQCQMLGFPPPPTLTLTSHDGVMITAAESSRREPVIVLLSQT